MVRGKWMVVKEYHFAPGRIKFYAFWSERGALDKFNASTGHSNRILFQPVEDGHMQVVEAGVHVAALNAIRKQSREAVDAMVPGRWMVVIRSLYFRNSRYYAFLNGEHAEHFLDSFTLTNGVLFDAGHQEVKTVGNDFLVINSIRHEVGRPPKFFLGCARPSTT